MNRKLWLPLIAYFFGALIIMTVIHEGAHAISALILGVPVSEITIRSYGINPAVVIPERFINSNLTLYYWSGGITAGVSFLAVYFLVWFRKFQRTPSISNSMLGLITFVVATVQLAQGYFEGRFHHAYIVSSGSMFNPLNNIIYIIVIASIFIHFSLFPMSKIKENN